MLMGRYQLLNIPAGTRIESFFKISYQPGTNGIGSILDIPYQPATGIVCFFKLSY
jgi:hypothetical protein